MALEWMDHAGKRILVARYEPGKGKDQENISILDQQGEIEEKDPNLLILSDYRGCPTSYPYIEKVNAYGKRFRSHPTNVRNAVLGITGMKGIFLAAYLAFTGDKCVRAFAEEKQALDWLTS